MHRYRALLALAAALALAGCVAANDRIPATGPTKGPDAETMLPTPTGEAVRISASGDFGSTDETSAVLADIARLRPDLHLALGDLSYGRTGEEESWCDFVMSELGADVPFELIAGNHESDGRNGDIADFAKCLPNRLPGLVGEYGRQWYVDIPESEPIMRVVMISPGLDFDTGETSFEKGSQQYTWTADAIDGARAADVPWVVVGMHEPCLSVGDYDCGATSDVMDLLIDRRVDLVLTGHEHLYQRTKQLAAGAGCDHITPDEFDADCIADADNDLSRGSGTVFVTVGTGGAELRDVNDDDPEAPYFASTNGDNTDPTWGSLEITATTDQLTARFVPAAGGSFRDAFTIRNAS